MDARRLTVRIPGQWEDAWLYREHLIAWDTSGRVSYIPLEALKDSVTRASDHHHGVLTEHLVLRSERKSSREFGELFAIPSVRRDFFEPLMAQPEVIISLDSLEMRSAMFDPIPGNINDTVAYGNRLLASSDAGVFEAQFNPRHGDASPLLQVVDEPSTSIVAGNGRFAASTGEAGLVSREVTFGDGDQWADVAEAAPITTLAPYSRGVGKSSVHLVNYGLDPVPEFIRATTRIEHHENGFKESIVTRFDPPTSLREVIRHGLSSDKASSEDNFEVLGNANYRLLVQRDLRLEVLSMRAFQNKPLGVTHEQPLNLAELMPHPVNHAMSTHALRSGFLMEHTRGVHVFGDSGVLELSDELVVQARTFPNSRRYIDTVVLVREESIDLIGFVDLDSDRSGTFTLHE